MGRSPTLRASSSSRSQVPTRAASAFQGFAEAFGELSGLGEVAFGFVAVAGSEPGPAQGGQALQDAPSVGDLTPQAERFTVVVLRGGPFLGGLGDCAEVGEDRAMERGRGRFGYIFQELQGVTEPGLGGGDVAAEFRWRPRFRSSGRAGWHRGWLGREPNARNAALH